MKINNVSLSVIQDAAEWIGAKVVSLKSTKKGFQLVIRPIIGGTQYRKISNGRKSNGISWEGHKVFMEEIYKVCPNAEIISCQATYSNYADFVNKLGLV